VAAERGVLSALWQYGQDAFVDVGDVLSPTSFSVESNASLYRALTHLLERGQAVDYATFESAAQELGMAAFFDKADERAHLRGVMNCPVNLASARPLAAKVAKLEVARKLATKLDEARSKMDALSGDEPLDEIISTAEAPIFEFSSEVAIGSQNEPEDMFDGLEDYVTFLGTNPSTIRGLPSGMAMLDKTIGGGFRRKTISVVGARMKNGKSFLANNICLHVAGKVGVPTLLCDTEMSKKDQWARITANISGVSIDDVESGAYYGDQGKRDAVLRAIARNKAMPYKYVSIAGKPFEETLSLMRRWVNRVVGFREDGSTNDCLIVLDYLKLMSDEKLSRGNMHEHQVFGFMMTALHNFCVKWDVPVLTFVQLNREGIEREESDVISQSDRIAWLCSNFTILKRKDPTELAENPDWNGKLVPVFSRHGAGLDQGDYINLNLNLAIGRMTEGPTRNSLFRAQRPAPNQGRRRRGAAPPEPAPGEVAM
jgi:replicative DNA helicase